MRRLLALAPSFAAMASIAISRYTDFQVSSRCAIAFRFRDFEGAERNALWGDPNRRGLYNVLNSYPPQKFVIAVCSA
jgi:hypothetical protein